MSHWRESVSALQWKLGKRERVFEDDVFIENTCLGSGSKRRTKFTRGHSFTQVTWFSWPMVSRDWICVGPPSLSWEQVAYQWPQNQRLWAYVPRREKSVPLPAASSWRGIQPFTAADSAQPMLISNHHRNSLWQLFSELISGSHD